LKWDGLKQEENVEKKEIDEEGDEEG